MLPAGHTVVIDAEKPDCCMLPSVENQIVSGPFVAATVGRVVLPLVDSRRGLLMEGPSNMDTPSNVISVSIIVNFRSTTPSPPAGHTVTTQSSDGA